MYTSKMLLWGSFFRLLGKNIKAVQEVNQDLKMEVGKDIKFKATKYTPVHKYLWSMEVLRYFTKYNIIIHT